MIGSGSVLSSAYLAAMVIVMLRCLCVINSMHRHTAHTVRIAFILMATAAFWHAMEAVYFMTATGGLWTPRVSTVALAVAVAGVMVCDRRQLGRVQRDRRDRVGWPARTL